jgi:hypothetical protein
MGDKPYGRPSLAASVQPAARHESMAGRYRGRKIRGRNFSSKKSIEGQPIMPKRKNRTGLEIVPIAARPGGIKP